MYCEMVKIIPTYESAWGLEDRYDLICFATGHKLLPREEIDTIKSYVCKHDLFVVEGREYL